MKYFIPFGGKEPEKFYQYISILKDYIGGVYFGISLGDDVERSSVDEIRKFLDLIKDIDIEKFFVINPPKSSLTRSDLKMANESLKLFGDLITGYTVSNLYLGMHLNERKPNLKFDISSNAMLHNPAQILYWKDRLNLYSVNVPRMYGRSFNRLKEYKEFVKEYDIKIKLLLNEMCIYGCPFETHCSYLDGKSFCMKNLKYENLLKSNWISPSYLNEIKDFVDIGKIVYRGMPSDWIFNALLHYVNVDDKIGLMDLCLFPKEQKKEFYLNIPIDKIPKKIFTCECKECYKCNICEKFVEKWKNKV